MAVTSGKGRFGPRHPRIAAAGFRLALPLADLYFRGKAFHRPNSRFAVEKSRELAARLARGETAFLAGISIGGFHNTGVALVEVTRDGGPRIICNNEEERFSGQKHTNAFPHHALAALAETMRDRGIGPEKIVAWLATYDYPLFIATGVRTLLEEFPQSLNLTALDHAPSYDGANLTEGLKAPERLARLFGQDRAIPIIGMAHHDNHAWFSYLASPFAREADPVMIVVIDGSGDFASTSLYLGEKGAVHPIRSNASLFDSLGMFYGVISSTQGGWTALSSEGRYMGAAAYGDMNRATNPFYQKLRQIFELRPDGDIGLNRALANWPTHMLREPYTKALIEILGPPIAPENMWNPDAVLRVEDIRHRPDTQERLDKAAATQMVFEDALFHIIDKFIRATGASRLVLTGGAALNAAANMRVLEQFDSDYYRRALGQSRRLHLWAPPVPGDAGVTIGAAYAFAASAGVGRGAALEHAFYCGRAPRLSEIRAALQDAPDLDWIEIGDASIAGGTESIADLMAYITAKNGIIALFQGPAETGPRALGHRSIVANPCNARMRELLNERVKYREAIRPIAPIATLAAAKDLFDLSDGASDDDYNAYNYMVLTVKAKPCAHERVPAVIHVDGTARVQIVRQSADPVTYAYLKALGRRIGVELAVNTSFNVGGPIAQTPVHAVETLRRANGMDGVFLFSEEGPVALAWIRAPKDSAARNRAPQPVEGRASFDILRLPDLLAAWRLETAAPVET